MSFGGHALDMVKKINQNKALRENHRSHLKKQAFTFKSSKDRKKITYPKLAEEELLNFKTKVKKQAKMQQRKLLIKIIPISIGATLITAVLFHLLGTIIANFLRSI